MGVTWIWSHLPIFAFHKEQIAWQNNTHSTL